MQMNSQAKTLIDDPLMTDAQVAGFMKLSSGTPKSFRARHREPFYSELKPIRIGRSVRYRMSVVQAYIEKQTTGTKQ